MDARLSSIGLVLLLLLIFILPDVAVSQYAQCRLGKTKLYNCLGKKYDRGNRTADFSNVTSYGRYLIKLKDEISKQIIDTICEDMANEAAFLGTCIYRYKRIWPGMLVRITGENLMVLLDKWHSAIDYVEVEGTFRVNGAVTQQNPPWGLDRIDRLPGQSLLNQLFSSPYSGDGVHVYVLDTGIRCTHQDFLYQDGRTDNYGRKLSRCSGGYDGIRDGYGTTDCNGHGTHCAGIVGGLKSGVAKDALVHPIRSMDCGGSGSYGAIMDGLEWISDNAVSPAVLSMSIATQASISIDQAVNNIVDDIGIVVVAAAGNFLQPACNYSPSRATKVVSVASSNIYNEMSWFSNYGTCVTIVAPAPYSIWKQQPRQALPRVLHLTERQSLL